MSLDHFYDREILYGALSLCMEELNILLWRQFYYQVKVAVIPSKFYTSYIHVHNIRSL